ncbi:unnamed protein product [Protopolystoma xenopodis]|uniref:Uncharacterized protein n=1 Tax=Protopolystoma xenopodis TaxID=117903 RepID=A0A448XRM2_9PLAT|nr:unnamed protein product [Protopolystoma xenopodis]
MKWRLAVKCVDADTVLYTAPSIHFLCAPRLHFLYPIRLNNMRRRQPTPSGAFHGSTGDLAAEFDTSLVNRMFSARLFWQEATLILHNPPPPLQAYLWLFRL